MSNNNFLNQKEIQEFELLFKLTQNQLKKVMTNFLKKYYLKNQIISTNSYVLAMGDIPVAIVAHLDTVLECSPKEYSKKEIFYDSAKGVFFSNSILGSDDRAGIFAIIQIIKSGYKPNIILTTDEEVGALGADALTTIYSDAPVELKYIIELDRRGANDCVFYDCGNAEFEKYIESFGFVTNFGSFSDISVICPSWGIAGVNLSIGYLNEHSASEHLYVGHMLLTIKRVKEMLAEADKAPKFEYIERRTYFNYNNSCDYDWDPSYGVDKETWISWHEGMQECVCCNYKDYSYNMIPFKVDEHNFYICPECAGTHEEVSWCTKCGEAFLRLDKSQPEICPDCEAKINDSNR